ncbi:hypothetical protein ACFFX0_26110 [Citricoccus parietis]|uniref:Uncharacterized protein n=1 Tax=Citricoccus parietis TaxID=592307 RepID=A0ABV5G771_9MICC
MRYRWFSSWFSSQSSLKETQAGGMGIPAVAEVTPATGRCPPRP